MKDVQVYKNIILQSVRHALLGEAFDETALSALPEEERARLYRFSAALDMSHYIGNALLDSPLSGESAGLFRRDALKAVYRCERQIAELQKVSALLEREGIAFIPLKGAVMRGFYPLPWLRTSSDVDILVRPEDCAKAEALICDTLSYRFSERTTHDVILVSPGGVHIELHHRLLESGVCGRADWPLLDIWAHSSPVESLSRCELSPEAFYYYHIAHTAKHFLLGGGGLRPFVDIWLLNRLPAYSRAGTAMLEQGGLLQFSRRCTALADYWLSGSEPDDATRQMEDFLLSGSLYGSAAKKAAVYTARQGGRLRHILRRAWLPPEELANRYPGLAAHPSRLVFYQLRRWSEVITNGHTDRLKAELQTGLSMSREEQADMSRFLADMGLME